MDTTEDSQATQQATQTAFDPRRFGQQISRFSDEENADIICLLYADSDGARNEIKTLVSSPEHARYTHRIHSTDPINSDPCSEDDAPEFDGALCPGSHALILKMSSPLKDPSLGFTFGRNPERCDINFAFDPVRKLSNVHFRIYVNDYGSVMLEDESMNGTIVDDVLLRKKTDRGQFIRRTLDNNSIIKIVMHEREFDLIFRVRIPRREGELEDAYTDNVDAFVQMANRAKAGDVNETIGPGPSGHVNLFAPTKRTALKGQPEAANGLQKPSTRLPREWRGNEKFSRAKVIGKGAFAIVYKTTSRFDGKPYAAKELDKRYFIKNGVLDQKVENEMKIMQKVDHPNIVKYVEHFDWEPYKLIIIMEYIHGGDLGQYIRDNCPIEEPDVKIIAEQLVDALGYLHENQITHRDVKPDNILIGSTNPFIVKLTDFGLSKMIDTEQTFLRTFCGTLLYCAPEVYAEYSSYDDHGRRTNRRNHRRLDRERYDHAVDIWSLGGVLFYTLTGSPPYPASNGVGYSELLDRIMKMPVDTSPLTEFNVSANGIHFLTRMIHVRPDTRATIDELKAHAWLAHTGSATGQDIDDDLGQSASQLSLDDGRVSQAMIADASPICEPRPNYSSGFESEKENATFGQPRLPKLFGEVSTIRSNNSVLEDHLDLPGSDASFGETVRYGSEVRDSLEGSDNFSTPRENIRLNENTASEVRDSLLRDNSRSTLLGMGSQSLGGASSILGNLNMKSVANANLGATSSSLATSKRKTKHGTSDEYDAASISIKPSTKRLKSQGGVLEDEDDLFASMPIMKNRSDRQINYPLPKTIYWDSRDESTWHLDYPEMTHLQHRAFEVAAEKRHEEWGPGTTPLWGLAMKYFPPSHGHKQENSIGESSDWDIPQTAPDTLDDQVDHQPTDLALDKSFLSAVTTSRQPKIEVGIFRSSPGSLVPGISIPLQDPILSWGRERNNTAIYEPIAESKVPKNAFRILLWREGYRASDTEFRPWDPTRSTMSRTMRASPEPDSYAFYIATKATSGIRINSNPLPPNEPKDATVTATCKYWMKLYHGDEIVFWGKDESRAQAKLTFECFWGGSSTTRPPDEPPTCVPASVARKLDRLWPKAAKSLEKVQIKEKAQAEQEVRMRNMLREQERSRVFEKLRLEAIKRLEERASRGTSRGMSPANPERAQSNPPVRWVVPPDPGRNAR